MKTVQIIHLSNISKITCGENHLTNGTVKAFKIPIFHRNNETTCKTCQNNQNDFFLEFWKLGRSLQQSQKTNSKKGTEF